MEEEAEHADKATDLLPVTTSQTPGSFNTQFDHVPSRSSIKASTSSRPTGHAAVKGRVTPDAALSPSPAVTAAATAVSSSRSNNLAREPSSPVLVNPGTFRPSGKMHHSVLSQSLNHNQTRARGQSIGVPPPPPPASFSITSILSSLQSDAAVQDDINSIAKIYGKSRLSMANEYASHRSPIGPGPGPGPDLGSVRVDGVDEDRIVPNLSLDTNAALHHVNNLETVEELPTPMSDRSRRESNAFSPHGSGVLAVSASGLESEQTRPHGFLSVWQARTRRGRTSGRTVQGLSSEVKAHGQPESFTATQPSELRDDVSGNKGSKAMRQLMRLTGN